MRKYISQRRKLNNSTNMLIQQSWNYVFRIIHLQTSHYGAYERITYVLYSAHWQRISPCIYQFIIHAGDGKSRRLWLWCWKYNTYACMYCACVFNGVGGREREKARERVIIKKYAALGSQIFRLCYILFLPIWTSEIVSFLSSEQSPSS